jgi:hypothetical protein
MTLKIVMSVEDSDFRRLESRKTLNFSLSFAFREQLYTSLFLSHFRDVVGECSCEALVKFAEEQPGGGAQRPGAMPTKGETGVC